MSYSARIDELEKKFSENARRYFAPLANEYRKAGDLERAIEICRAHLPQQPGHMSGHIVYGQALYEARQLEEAKTVFEAALALDPENLIALRHLGDIARDTGDPGTARVWYTRVLDADPRNDEVAAMLAELDASTASAPPPAVGGDAPASPAASAGLGWGDINPERPAVEEDAPVAAREEAGELAIADGFAAAEASKADEAAPEAPEPPKAAAAPAALPAAPASPPADAELDEETFAEVDALFEELTPAAKDAPVETDSAPTGEPPDASDSHEILGLEVREFVPPSRPSRTTAPQSAVDSTPVPGLVSFGSGPVEDATTRPAFVTETMAELYLQQGFTAEALDIYRQLLAQNPDDSSLHDRVKQLAAGGKNSLSVAAVSSEIIEAAKQRQAVRPVRTVRSFFGLLAGHRGPSRGTDGPSEVGTRAEFDKQTDDLAFPEPTTSSPSPVVSLAVEEPAPPPRRASAPAKRTDGLSELFGDGNVSEDDESAASTLYAAFSGAGIDTASPAAAPATPSSSGRAARAGGSELSLGQVFRESAGRGAPRKSGAYSFDQFFAAAGTRATPGSEPAVDPEAATETPGEGEDLEQFTAWLEGLKRK